MFRKTVIAIFLLAAVALQGAPAHSAGLADEVQPPVHGWEFSMTPYFWTIFITGEQTAGNTTTDIDTNFFEIIDEAKELYAFMTEMELRKGRVGILADIFWAKIRVPAEETLEGDIPTIPVLPSLPLTVNANGGVTVNIAVIEAGGAYEIINRSQAGSFKDPGVVERSTAVDVLAGARYTYLKPEIAFNVTATVSIPALGLSRTAGGRVTGGKTIDWWDPFIGLRVRHQRGPGKELVVRGDIGGFGVGSDFTWQLEGLYNFDTRLLGHDVTAQLGYRALYADYEQGQGRNTLAFDWLWHGPVMGLKMKF